MFKDKKAHERIDNLVQEISNTQKRVADIDNGSFNIPSGITLHVLMEQVTKIEARLSLIPVSKSYGSNYFDMIERQRKISHDAMVFRIAALENMVTLLVGALGKEFVEEPEVPAVPAVLAAVLNSQGTAYPIPRKPSDWPESPTFGTPLMKFASQLKGWRDAW